MLNWGHVVIDSFVLGLELAAGGNDAGSANTSCQVT